MSKKITSYEELLKKGKECEALIEVRKKWEDIDLSTTKVVRVGIGHNTFKAKKLADEVSLAVIKYIKDNSIEDVAVVQNEFYGYSGDKPSIELAIPQMGRVVFGNMEPAEAVKLVEKYMVNTDEIAHFLVDNHGNRKKNH